MDLLDKMATFVRVIEAGSFSSAAKQLRISPGAVSRQMATLEADVGAGLILRSTRRMTITEAGRRYYERCLRILREVDDARGIGRSDQVDGALQVSASVTFGLARVVPHVPSLLARYPGLRLDLRLEDRLLDLALEGVDVAIRVGSAPPDSANVVANPLMSFRRRAVAAPAYLKRKGEPKTPEALAKHDVLTHSGSPAPDVWSLRDDEREARVRVNVTFRSNALHALRELAVAGAGIALLPEWLVTDQLKRRTLRPVLDGWRSGAVPVQALFRTEHRGSRRVRALVEHLRRELARDDA
jgi:DNA-binding transcriptional LysR family regulator